MYAVMNVQSSAQKAKSKRRRRKMKIFFVNPMYSLGFSKSARWSAKSRGRTQRHPDYLAMATAVSREAGHQVYFLDAQAKNLPYHKSLEMLEFFKPDMTVIWSTTPSIYSDIAFAEQVKIKDKNCMTVLVGAHPSALPEETLKISDKIDAIAFNEFDYTIRDLANGARKENCLGLAWRKGNEIKINKQRPFITDLDSLPFPAWEFLDPFDYSDAGKLYPFITQIGSRSCPNACSFCNQRYNISGGAFRKQSPQRRLDEIQHDFKLFPMLKEIMIEDDTLASKENMQDAYDFCWEIMNRGMDFTWSANARPNIADATLLKTMKNCGLRMLCVGYEFGSQKSLDAVNKNITLAEMRLFSKLTRMFDIKVNGCFMIGAPNETRESALQTIEFAKELNPNTAQFSVIVPYPSTPFYDWAKKSGFIIAKDWDEWVNEDFEQSTVISYPQLSKEEMEGLVDRGLKEFYLRKGKVTELMFNIKSMSDIKRFYHGIRSFINYFLRF